MGFVQSEDTIVGAVYKEGDYRGMAETLKTNWALSMRKRREKEEERRCCEG